MSIKSSLDLFPVSDTVRQFIQKNHRHYINGRWVEGSSEVRIDVIDPATGQKLTCISDATQQDVNDAVKAASEAFEGGIWSRLKPVDRERLMLRLADLLEQDRDILAVIETLDNGKPLAESQEDIGFSIDYMRYMAGWATKIDGRAVDISSPGHHLAYVRREPVGVVAGIVPWNFPLLLALWKIVPALVTGCSIVLKPSEQTSLSVLRLAELIEEAGYPQGAANIITGYGAVAGSHLVSHPLVQKISFTGSTRTGKMIGRTAVNNMARMTLELGGKSPVIVLKDADIKRAAQGIATGIFYNQGQLCCAGSRLIVHQDICQPLMVELKKITSEITLAPGLDHSCTMGPLVSRDHQASVLNYIAVGQKEGAELITGGTAPEQAGCFVTPTIFQNVTPDMSIFREEIFGPVLTVTQFSSVSEAIQLANDTKYGLAASLWSNDLARVIKLIPEIKAGTVWVNNNNISDPALPFGGMKQSGYGRELGKEQLDGYLEDKAVWISA